MDFKSITDPRAALKVQLEQRREALENEYLANQASLITQQSIPDVDVPEGAEVNPNDVRDQLIANFQANMNYIEQTHAAVDKQIDDLAAAPPS